MSLTPNRVILTTKCNQVKLFELINILILPIICEEYLIMSFNQRYVDLSLAYMSVLQEEEIVLTKFKGNDAYIFSCLFCAHNYQHQAKPKKVWSSHQDWW